MDCAEFENVIVGIVRREMGDAEARDAAWAHAGTCERCARRLAGEQILSAAFRAAAAEDARRQAPPVVEKMLLSAFREHQSTLRHRQRAWMTRAITGAVAAVLVVAGFWALRRPEPPRVSPRAIHPQANEFQIGSQEVDAGDDVDGMTDFIPVVYDSTPIEMGRVVRVQLPREALIAFGLQFHERDSDNELIGADILLDDDGLARAVRFAR